MPVLPSAAPSSLRRHEGLAGVPVRAFTVDEYHALGDLGVLGPDERTELIDGHIVPMSPVSGPHIFAVQRLSRMLHEALRALPEPRPFVSVQNPIRLGPRLEPEPDVTLLHAAADAPRVPTAEDGIVAVEVSVATRAYDRD